jgi:hypothetical protein
MARPLTNAERQRRYIARLKERAAPAPDIETLIRALVAARARIVELETKLERVKRRARRE